MIKKIHSATVTVANKDAALEFYVNVLGWEKRIDQSVDEHYRFVTVAPVGGDAELALEEPMFGNTPGGQTILLSPAGVQIMSDAKDVINITPGGIQILAGSNLINMTPDGITISGTPNLTLTATGALSITAGGAVSIKAPLVTIN